jgi:cytochrome c peroxidase
MKHVSCSLALAIGAAVSFPAGAADDQGLLKQARQIFKPLPSTMASEEFPAPEDRVQLGRMLFFDPRLTVDGNMSCASCHQPAFYGTDALPKSIGVKQRPHPRHAPTVLNAGAQFVIHWRGDRVSLEDQAFQAQVSPITGGLPDHQAVAARVEQIPGYAPMFNRAFTGESNPISAQNVAKAISAFERTLVTPSAFDAYLAGNVEALSPQARAGLTRFINTGCIACHDGVGVGGGKYAKFGVVEDYWRATGSQPIDKGRADVTNNPDDLYVFRVASLRNVAMIGPYFHDGSVARLPDAVKVMGRVQLGVRLSDADTNEIVAFLESLTGKLPANFANVPALPPGSVISPR